MNKDGRVNETILINSTIKDEPVVLQGCTNCKIVNCDFSFDKAGKTMLTLEDCKRCVISKCEFHDKTTAGLLINIKGKNSKDNIIEGCRFSNFKFMGTENAEPIRIGESKYSGCRFKTIVRFCHFDHLEADVETVSIKSCGNILENNKHEDCKSSFVIRHGGFNIIRNNLFIGSGGIRVHGNGNEITGNYHKNNNNKDKPPLIISNGTLEDDPNFDDEGKPHDSEGCSHHAYAHSKNNKIEGNTYANCGGKCVDWGKERKLKDNDKGEKNCNDKKYKLKENIPPTKNKFENNTMMVDDEDIHSTFLVFSETAQVADNVFEANKLFGDNAKRGHVPQEAIKRLATKPEIEIPNMDR
jgi:hypothetical protein